MLVIFPTTCTQKDSFMHSDSIFIQLISNLYIVSNLLFALMRRLFWAKENTEHKYEERIKDIVRNVRHNGAAKEELINRILCASLHRLHSDKSDIVGFSIVSLTSQTLSTQLNYVFIGHTEALHIDVTHFTRLWFFLVFSLRGIFQLCPAVPNG